MTSETDRAETAPPDSEEARPGEAAAPPPADDPGEAPAADDGAAQGGEAPAERDYEAELAALNDRLLRTLAESENQRRRDRREREETARYAVAGFARDMLGVADNLRRALEALPDGAAEGDEALKSLIDGVALTERELEGIFARHGVEKIDPQGKKFDHNLHEAMFELPTADAAPGTVVQVVQAGYVIRDRLLRAARVGIAKAPPEPPPADASDAPEAGADESESAAPQAEDPPPARGGGGADG